MADNNEGAAAERCTSCRNAITNMHGTASFACPQCGKQEILRCERCRRLGAKYSCAECRFEGPN